MALSDKARGVMDRIKEATDGIPWAFGPPIANVYRKSYRGSALRIYVPDGCDAKIEGAIVKHMKPKAFDSLEFINNYPILSYGDTILALFQKGDVETAYHMLKNDGICVNYLIERALEEGDANACKDMFVTLSNMTRFRPYANRVEQFIDESTRERAGGLSEEGFEESMRGSYDIPPFDIDIEKFINETLEKVHDSAKKR